ncbi:MAG TPA: HtaA domain-containing protein [Microbacterium sp.]|nr:HtaA domain-containing protein [Microbacterium sp.]
MTKIDESTAAGTLTAVDGALRWNVKQSFRDYVGELPDGEEVWTGAAGGISDDGDLVFPAVEMILGTRPEDDLRFVFEGGVRFAGYGGMLRVEIRDPWLEVGESTSALTVDVAPPGSTARRVAIATLEGRPQMVEGGVVVWNPGSTALTAAGAALLGSVYPPGTEADGFGFRATLA